MIRFKRGLLDMLKDKGYNTNYLRQNHLLGQATIQKLRTCADGDNITTQTINTICNLLKCDISDVLEYVPDYDEDR